VHFRGQHAATAVLEAAATNARNVALTICAVRDYCGNRGVPQGPQGFYGPWHVLANFNGPSRALCSTLAVHIGAGREMDVSGDPRPPFNDIIAHEFGHIRDCVSAGDRSSGNREIDEVEEALADMFAYDYDRDDATLGEDAGPASVDWQTPANRLYSGQPQPDHMDDYDPTPPGPQPGDPPDEHFNSTILSHAYYLFVQDVGHDRAGHVLQTVPSALSPKPTFKEVAQAFFNRARALYGTEISGPGANAFGQVGLLPITDPQPDPPEPPNDPDYGPETC